MILLITILSLSDTDSSWLMRCGALLLTCDGTTTRLLSSFYCLKETALAAFDNNDIYQPQLPDL